MRKASSVEIVLAVCFLLGACVMPMSNPGYKRNNNFTPLQAAACKGDRAEVEHLLKHGYKANDEFWAYQKGDGGNALTTYFECVDRDFRKGQPIDLELVGLLLEAGADPNKDNWQSGRGTPLRILVTRPNVSNRLVAAAFLIQHGADPYSHRRTYTNAMNEAINRNDQDMINVLEKAAKPKSIGMP
jgi:ankyrin repeat protein